MADICLVEYSWPVWGVSNNFIDASNKFWQLFNARSRKQKRKFRHEQYAIKKRKESFHVWRKMPCLRRAYAEFLSLLTFGLEEYEGYNKTYLAYVETLDQIETNYNSERVQQDK